MTPLRLSSLLMAGVLAIPSPVLAQETTLETKDGLKVQLSAAGRITDLRIGDTRLPLKADGGFSVADYHNQPEPENLVPNPGFEEGAAGWSLGRGQSIVTDIVHGGKAAVRLEVPGPATGNSNVGCLVPVKPNTRYRVGIWLRRENVGVCGAYASERDDKGKLTGKRTQVGVTIPKRDGVWLPLSWEIVTEPETTRLSLRADIYRSTGTLWLDDFSIVEVNEGVYQPMPGRIQRVGDQAKFRGKLPQAGLELDATFSADEHCVRVDGIVRDTTGEDRALGVKFALPLDLAGWTWHNDAEEREPIATASHHRHTYNCESGIGVCSVYPWSALSGPEAGLTLALSLSQGPRVFLLQHDQRLPQTSLTFYFGLCADAARNPSSAPFSFVLYRHDPAWGMRSAMERYYRLFPESFLKRPAYEGFLNYANLERLVPAAHRLDGYAGGIIDAGDFGEGYRFLWHMHGCYDFRMVHYDDPKRPSDETVLALLNDMVAAEKEKSRHYIPTAETLKKLVYDSEGHIRYIGDTRYWRPQEGYNHTDKPGWGLNFRVNEDPGVSNHLAEVSRRTLEKYAQDPDRQPFDACFTADAIEGYHGNTRGLDYRREHFKTTDVPLTFGKRSLKVAMPNTIWDFHHKVWWPLTQQYKVITYGNANGYEQAFTMPYVDIPMIEWEWDRGHPERFERYLRAIAYQKIWRFWRVCGNGEKDPASVRRHFHRGLAYAVYPCVGALQSTTGDIEPYRAAFRQYVPAIEELSAAGWEPIPHAHATEGLIVERYGEYARGDLHLTFRNYAEQAKQASVALDREALGIPDAARLVTLDILPGSPRLIPLTQDPWNVEVEADGARAFWIGTAQQAAQRGLRLAERTLDRIARLFSTELTDANKEALARAREAARRGAKGDASQALAAAQNLQRLALDLQGTLETKSPVDRDKLLLRLRVDLSHVPAALLGIESAADRVREDGLRGETTRLAWSLSNRGKVDLTDLNARVVSPWSEVESRCQATPAVKELPAGKSAELAADLFVPAKPPRQLMPYLLEVRGKAGEAPFTLAIPTDLRVSAPLSVSVSPKRVFRGEERELTITVANRLKEPAPLRLKFAPPAKASLTPPEITLNVPANGEAEAIVVLALDLTARLGSLRLPYTITSEVPKFNQQGSASLSVSDPVPQAEIPRVGSKPKIDGNLNEPAWQRPPTIPELRMLAGGGPAAEKTAVWVAYDDEGLCVAFRCSESQMDKLQAKLTDRGSPLYREDDVEVFIQPPGSPRCFQFAVNALGARSDNFGNETNWIAAAQRLDEAWTVEMFVPYSAIGVATAPKPGACWPVQFGRQQKAKPEVTSWTPGRAFNVPEGFGELSFR